jgi:DNA gyrase subunit A
LTELTAEIAECLKILQQRPYRMDLMRRELLAVREKFATPRMTAIEEYEGDQDIEDLIPREDMIVTFSQSGYIKRVPISTYRAQKRGGKGRAAMATKDEDFVTTVFAANTHTPMLFFTNAGRAYALKVYKLPLGNPQSKGKPMINLLPLSQGETISTIMPLPEDESKWDQQYVMFATSHGNVRRNKLSDFLDIRASGKIAMKLEGDEKLIGVNTCDTSNDVLLSTGHGKAIRFSVEEIRVFAGRNSTGVRGIKLANNDSVISLDILKNVEASAEERAAYVKHAKALRREENGADDENGGEEEASNLSLSPERITQLAAAEQFILTVTAKGFGKRSSAYDFRTSGRGGQGVASLNLQKKHGWVVGSFLVNDGEDIMIVTNGGTILRTPVADIRIAGRATQGVTLFRVEEHEHVVSVARLADNEEAEKGEN